ncbi:MAG TPA: zf-HC2 domain-containing protein [Kofleriaceae bacterium]|nr:zf-HC2 domain-containing protein [Kofleriaceae bacterium]
MTCREAQARLTAYLDGELDGSTASAIRGHLRVCDDCRHAAEDHAAIRDSLAGLARPEPPPAIWDGVMAKLGEAEIADSRRSRWSRLLHRLRPHLLPASLAVGACAAAAVIVHVRQDEPRRAAPQAVAPIDPAERGATDLVPPPAPPPIPPVTRDATIELAAETERIDARYREVAADLLGQAREQLGEKSAARRRFDREVAGLERAVLAAPAGKARDRAWHALITFLERAAIGELVAQVRR